MKYMFTLLLFIFLSTTYAQNYYSGQWYPIINCEDGTLKVDKAITGVSGSYRSYSYQIVVDNMNLAQYFLRDGRVNKVIVSDAEIVDSLPELFKGELSYRPQFSSKIYDINFSVNDLGNGWIKLLVKYSDGRERDWSFHSCSNPNPDFYDKY